MKVLFLSNRLIFMCENECVCVFFFSSHFFFPKVNNVYLFLPSYCIFQWGWSFICNLKQKWRLPCRHCRGNILKMSVICLSSCCMRFNVLYGVTNKHELEKKFSRKSPAFYSLLTCFRYLKQFQQVSIHNPDGRCNFMETAKDLPTISKHAFWC